MAAQRGEIYFVDLNSDNVGEQAYSRPILVLSINAVNRLPLVVTVVVGTRGEKVTRDYLANVRVPPEESGLPVETVFLGFQIRSLHPKRFSGPPVGQVSNKTLEKIEEAVKYCLGL